MKKVSVIVLVVVGLAFSAYADAAHPKRRTRNANRIGPYAGAMVAQSRYTGDHGQDEQDLNDTFNGRPTQDLSIGTKDKDLGYAAQFGYRFSRYIAAEFELAQYGELRSHARASVDFGNGAGFLPVSIDLKFHGGGPKLSVIGILPCGDKFELYGQVGMLFASSERQLIIKVNNQSNSFGSVKGDSSEVVYGAGAAWHINQMYTIRLGYERINDLGDPNKTGTEDLTNIALGLIVRF
jgi:opacity protein-like surface antigen